MLMNNYIINLEMDEEMYRLLKDAKVVLSWKHNDKVTEVPFSKRQIKYQRGRYLYFGKK